MSPTTETLPAGITLTPFRADDAFAMQMTEQAMQSFAGIDLARELPDCTSGRASAGRCGWATPSSAARG